MSSHCKDIDDFLKTSDHPVADFNHKLERAAPAEKHAGKSNLNPEDYSFRSFQPLGELPDGRILFSSTLNRKTYDLTLKDLNLDQLVQMGGEEVFERVSRKFQEGKIPFEQLKKRLIIEAAKHQLPDFQRIGQGIHLLKNGCLIIINGGKAWTWDGSAFVYHDHPMIEENLIDWQPGREGIDFNAVMEEVKSMNAEKGGKIVDSILNLFAQWGFKANLDHVMLCGWFLAQIIQSTWEWRPHIWLSGAQGSGKSLLIALIRALGGKLALSFEGKILTEPGLRQAIKNDSVLITIDEFEKSDHRDKIIDLLRSAGRGGSGAKGTTGQNAIISKIKHMVMVASIETGLNRASENSRFLQLETKKDSENRNPQMPDASLIHRINVSSCAFSIWAATRAKKLIQQMDYINGFERRLLESLAVPFSMMSVCSADPVNELNSLLRDYLSEWSASQDGSMQEDEQRLFEDIMMAKVRIHIKEMNPEGDFELSRYVDRTVAQIIEDPKNSKEGDSTLQAHGIKVCQDGLFMHPSKVMRELLQNTPWHNLQISKILQRLPGATVARRRLAGIPVDGVVVRFGVSD